MLAAYIIKPEALGLNETRPYRNRSLIQVRKKLYIQRNKMETNREVGRLSVGREAVHTLRFLAGLSSKFEFESTRRTI